MAFVQRLRAWLVACGSSGSEETPTPFLLRVACAIERFIDRDDMRVRQEGVDRCAGAARQMAESRERMREARRMALVEAAEQVFAERGFAGATVADIAEIPDSLPLPTLPPLSVIPGLLIPALSLALVGLPVDRG